VFECVPETKLPTQTKPSGLAPVVDRCRQPPRMVGMDMKPTLFMEDITFTDVLAADSLSSLSIVQHMLALVLPRRCPFPDLKHHPHDPCAGFLYPDPPDWWIEADLDDPTENVVTWREFLHDAYRVLGVVEDTE